MRAKWNQFVAWFNSLDLSENMLLLVFAVAVGALSALGVVAFYKLIDLSFTVFYRLPGEHVSRGVFLAYRPIVTAAGFMCAYLAMRRLGRGRGGGTVPDVQLAVARTGGRVRTRQALARTFASVITLGSGGSAGSEGPVAVLGSTAGSWLAELFQFDASRVRVMVGAGAAAGISAAFNAPLAGAFFALEEILGAYSAAAFAPVVVSSVIGAVVSRAFFGNHPAFPIPRQYGSALSMEIFVLYPLLAVICGFVAVAFVRTYFLVADHAKRWERHQLIVAAVGGALVGLMVYASQGVLVGYGHLALRVQVFGRMAWYSLALLAIGKIVATSVTLNTGGSGGVFTPSLYVGAATGGAFGVAVAKLFPALHLAPEAYGLVGMGAIVAAATDAPITGILIVFEMTNDYAIMPGLMMVVVITMLVAKRMEKDSLYSGYLRRRGERIEHGVDRDVLSTLRVADVYERATPIPENARLSEVLKHLERITYTDIPVATARGGLAGMITVADLGRLAQAQHELGALVIAGDVATQSEIAHPNETLFSVIQKMGRRGVGTLPVVDPATGHLMGVVTRSHVLAAYEKTVAATS